MFSFFNRQQQQTRQVSFEKSDNNKKFSNNQITTTKYNIFTFLPKSIILQFVRPANFVYLATAVLQLVPILSAFSPIAAISPFIVVIMISIIREGYQDYKRYKNDKQTNFTKTLRLVNSVFQECDWQDLHVGDYIKITNQSIIPADIILLNSSEQNGICYVETANLDGQRNLKNKNSLSINLRLFPQEFEGLKGSLIIDKPNNKIHQCNGIVYIQNNSVNISDLNILLRGTKLKNTDQVVGIVVYAGQDTKIMKNKGEVRHKVSRVEKKVNNIQIVLAIVLVILCIICGSLYYQTWKSFGSRMNIFYLRTKTAKQYSLPIQSIFICFTAFLLLNFLVPISMNISLELLKTFQGDLLQYDCQMSYQVNQKLQYCGVYNSSIIQQLGIVEYILTDKTGTLTSNQMAFKQIWTNNQQYHFEEIQMKHLELTKDQDYQHFWRMILLCHDVVVDTKNGQYQGSSADEVCFLQFAKKINYIFKKRTSNSIQLQIFGQKVYYQLLLMLPFDQRKMMSVIVKDLEKNKILLITKGADNCVLSRKSKHQNQQHIGKIKNSLFKLSKKGFRTLVFGQRQLLQSQFEQKYKNYKEFLQLKLSNTFNKQQIKQLQKKAVAEFENQFKIYGVTAVEDKLQDGVPQTIQRLQQADITIVMITGDKLETAQNIGYLSNFILQNSKVYYIREDNIIFQKQIIQILNNLQSNESFSLLIQGAMIGLLLSCTDPDINNSFKVLVSKCKSLIFCRSTPAQKGDIVKYFKNTFNKPVLAIGDGGNDVNMIQQADIGIGILGKEGNQAAASSDFYFAQFRFLDRLLLHHGRWGYVRISYFFVYYGFKNIILTMVLFYYMFYCGYSVQQFITDLYLTCYNSILSLVLTLYYGVYQQDINADIEKHLKKLLPAFYKQYREKNLFSYKRYAIWSSAAVLASILVFFVTIYATSSIYSTNINGQIIDYKGVLSNLSISLFLIITLVILNDMHNFTIWTWICVIPFTFFIALLYYLLENYINFSTTTLGLMSAYYSYTDNFNWIYYFVILFNTMVCYSIKVLIQTIQFYDYGDSIQKKMIQRYEQQSKKVTEMKGISEMDQINFKNRH